MRRLQERLKFFCQHLFCYRLYSFAIELDVLDIDVAVVALGAVRNVEWLNGAKLAADARGVVCDASCRVFDEDGMVTDDIFVAGDDAFVALLMQLIYLSRQVNRKQ
jgi:hypothetical protein